MRIASVTFYPKLENIGGGQIPAFAFKEWCDILNIECDVYGICDDITGIELQNYFGIIHSDDVDILNSYDAIFFSTPPMYCDIDLNKIEKPFMVMIHGEYDEDLYGADNIIKIINHSKCIGDVHINANKRNELSSFYWHPCCSPNDLINDHIIPKDSNGMLYAARITDWLNYKLFLNVANENRDITKEAHMYGPCLRPNIKEDVIKTHEGVNIHIGPFRRGEQYGDNTGLFWDVTGSYKNKVKYNRISLSAYEALKNGYLPIIREGTAPHHFKDKFIEIEYDATHLNIRAKLLYAIKNKEIYWEMINEVASSSYTSYEAIKYQFSAIINHFERNV